MLVNNSIIIHPESCQQHGSHSWSFPVFLLPCSISRQVAVNLTSNHQTCLLHSTSALAFSVQVLIFVMFSRDLFGESPSWLPTSDRVTPWWQRCNLTQLCLTPFQGTLLSTKWGQDSLAMVPICSDPASPLFISHLTTLYILCSDYNVWLFPRKTLPRLHTLHLRFSILCHSEYGPWTSSINTIQELITESESMC